VHDSPLIIEIAKEAGADAYVLESAAVKDLNVTGYASPTTIGTLWNPDVQARIKKGPSV
jgi:hypothetical protein